MGLALLSAAISGMIFGIGLALAGMLNPAKVAGFLDIFGLWDPSLMLVMAGGIMVNAAGYFLFVRGGQSSFSHPHFLGHFLPNPFRCQRRVKSIASWLLAVGYLVWGGDWLVYVRVRLSPALVWTQRVYSRFWR